LSEQDILYAQKSKHREDKYKRWAALIKIVDEAKGSGFSPAAGKKRPVKSIEQLGPCGA